MIFNKLNIGCGESPGDLDDVSFKITAFKKEIQCLD